MTERDPVSVRIAHDLVRNGSGNLRGRTQTERARHRVRVVWVLHADDASGNVDFVRSDCLVNGALVRLRLGDERDVREDRILVLRRFGFVDESQFDADRPTDALHPVEKVGVVSDIVR